ncbi:Crp/Fnr family transcriptional regulator [Photobacterium sanctipauli]|uniref:Crp/Fnr family transcriptional regulator n=1 Tax=Photobacterium sanctipauli TaxID=1342794 RepID=A0A2T3NA27_9GAMM|nr:Crp/Fnr family transcriptional regulator [Photobacterium sanctipauli]PSW10494.1 Crp/Fnr family transcriptional regulator [Photobacterium sanctipauli]
MKSALTAFLRQHGATDHEIEQATNQGEPLELPTRHILLNQGEEPTYCYFLHDGICHACYLTPEGKQFSKEFYWDQDVLIGFESLLGNMPSPFLLETLNASRLIALPIALLKEWRQQHSVLYRTLLERQLQFKEHKERFMLIHSPEERYLLFTSNFPDLTERLSDYQIASYLGITSTSLSRIKKRCQQQNDEN